MIDAAAEDQPGLVARLLGDLSQAKELPRQALDLAEQNWEEVLPAFLAMLDAYVEDPERNADSAGALFYIVHLFGQMREARAYRPLMRLFAMDPEAVGELLGDGVTATAGRIAASVFDGDPAPIEAVILDADADIFLRGGLLEALAFLTGEGRIERERTAAFLSRCAAEEKARRGDDYFWISWQSAVAYLGPTELVGEVRAAFRDGRIDPMFMRREDFEGDLWARLTGDRERIAATWGSLGYFGRVADELAGWQFDDSEETDAELDALAATLTRDAGWSDEPLYEAAEPAFNPLRHVSRNDPCPCGSGKKFKKCCLGRI